MRAAIQSRDPEATYGRELRVAVSSIMKEIKDARGQSSPALVAEIQDRHRKAEELRQVTLTEEELANRDRTWIATSEPAMSPAYLPDYYEDHEHSGMESVETTVLQIASDV